MTRFDKIHTGDLKTVGMMMEQYTAALMNGTAPVDVRAWLEQEADDDINRYLPQEYINRLGILKRSGINVTLPCEVGDTVFVIQEKKFIGPLAPSWNENPCILKCRVCHVAQNTDGIWKFQVSGYDETGKYTQTYKDWFYEQDYGKTVFPVRSEAEAALSKKGSVANGQR